jgi:hypothetical protein
VRIPRIVVGLIFLRKRGLDPCFLVEVNWFGYCIESPLVLDRVVSGGLNNSGELFTARAARADLLSKAGLAAQAAAARTTLALRVEPVLFKLRGRAIAQGAVSAMRVVEGFDIVEDHQFSGGFGGRNRVGEACPRLLKSRAGDADNRSRDAVAATRAARASLK